MSPNLRIAFRFLTAKKRAMLMSLSCTVLGVGLFILTQATTTGFERFFIQTILGINGAIRIEDKIQDTMRSMEAAAGSDFRVRQTEGVKLIEGIDDPQPIIDAVRRFAGVTGASAVLRGNAQFTSAFTTKDGQVFGIKLVDHERVSNIGDRITAGKLDNFREARAGALVGRVLADQLQLRVGDPFSITVRGEVRQFRVSAIYETGYRDVDKSNIYIDLREARSLMHKPTGATFIQLRLADPDRAPALADRMTDVLRYKVTPWQVREQPWLMAFRALRISSGITVAVFTLIAGLAMFNTLLMMVIEKTKDIAILRSMGYERRDITQIFLWQAAIVLAIGAVVGAIFGYVVTWIVEQVPLPITGIFKAEHFLVVRDPSHYVEAIAIAVIMVMVASLIPARRAARLEPGDIIRGTAQ
jgi:lipoprotein-releasing system permease protein